MLRPFLAVAVLMAGPVVVFGQDQTSRGLTPEVLYWRDSDAKPYRATGLLYRPELLSALIAGRPPETVPERIRQAVNEQTPIVVMWAIPDGPAAREAVALPRLFIRDTTSGNRVEPVWETQDAADLRLIDPHTPFQPVGAIAAFPRSAFQSGRIVTIHAPLPDNPATGAHRAVQVFGEFAETRLAPNTGRIR
jgi:hypothetical protein